ncbi:MAG: hypothetical protein DRP56_00335 [Planctomycetota bacterium]|nr:MAG: hypothetical protein DRP56_00335 [Planctomycetota bacterium]
MNGENKRTGRAKVPVVLSDGPNQLAAVATVIASVKHSDSNRCKLSCTDGAFNKQTVKHYRRELLAALNSLCQSCQLPYCDFELSAENLQAAAINDARLEISGFSADISVFVAMLSAALGIEVPDDSIFSGHMSKGRVLPVASLAAKLKGAIAGGLKRFYCASLNPADSLAVVDSAELDAADNAIRMHRRDIEIRCADTVFELFDAVFSDYDVLLAAIHTGVFNTDLAVDPKSPVERIAQKIGSVDMPTLRNTLSTLTMAENIERVYTLWNAFLTSSINAGRYPVGCGELIYEWMCTVPPHIRRSGLIKIPLIEMEVFVKLSRLAGKEHFGDLGLLFDGIRGKYLKSVSTAPVSKNNNEGVNDCLVFDSVVSSISAKHLDESFGTDIDNARASFILPSTVVESYADFTDFTEAFYNHLCGFTKTKPTVTGSGKHQSAAVYSLIDRAFANKGGYAEARCRAIDGGGGGLRVVLDEITEQFKRDIYADQINASFKRAIDIRDDDEKKAFIAGALKRLDRFLPDGWADRDPASLLGQTEVLAKIYVKAVDAVRQNMSRL